MNHVLKPLSRQNYFSSLLSKPVKEEQAASAREAICEDFFEELLSTLNLDPDALPGWRQGWPAREHVRLWSADLCLDPRAIIAVAAASRQDHLQPPDGPKALDRAMQRAAQCLKQTSSMLDQNGSGPGGGGDGRGRNAAGRRKRDDGLRPSEDELAAF